MAFFMEQADSLKLQTEQAAANSVFRFSILPYFVSTSISTDSISSESSTSAISISIIYVPPLDGFH